MPRGYKICTIITWPNGILETSSASQNTLIPCQPSLCLYWILIALCFYFVVIHTNVRFIITHRLVKPLEHQIYSHHVWPMWYIDFGIYLQSDLSLLYPQLDIAYHDIPSTSQYAFHHLTIPLPSMSEVVPDI